MKRIFGLLLLLLFCTCGKSGSESDTILDGTATILVEKTILPIVEEQQQVFESQYRGRLTLVPATEEQILKSLAEDKARLAFLPRKLTAAEEKTFTDKNITAKITAFASDALVFFKNRSLPDTLLREEEVLKLFKKQESSIQQLIFCNSDLSLLSELMSRAVGNENIETDRIFGFDTEMEVVNYLLKNPNAIGVLPLNRVLSPSYEFEQVLPKIRAMAVKSVKMKDELKNYYKPNQSNVAANLYPFSRTLYMLNYQGKAGLGMGFASFIAGDIGQRIVLKSGLVPVRIPPRIIATRKKVIKN